jgi:hypothetical protein
VKFIVPVVQARGTSGSQEPGAAVDIDGIGSQLIAGERVIIVYGIGLKIAGAKGHTVERGVRVSVGIGSKAGDSFAGKHSLGPDPGADMDGESCLYREVYLCGRSDADSEEAATATIDRKVMIGNSDKGSRNYLLGGSRVNFHYFTAKGNEWVVGREG